MKFDLANFYLNLSLKAKDFTRAKHEFHFCEAKISNFSAGEIFLSRRSLVPQASPGRSSRRRVPGNALARFWGSDVAGDEGTPFVPNEHK